MKNFLGTGVKILELLVVVIPVVVVGCVPEEAL